MQQVLPRATFHGRYGVTPWRSLSGFGDAASTAKAVQIGGSMGASTATAVLASLTAHGGTVLGLTSAAVPVIGAALAGATMLVQYLIANSGCGQTCIVTSQWANQAADALQQVKDAYFALPTPRTETQKAVAVANFYTIWNKLKELCGQPGTGDAGVRCISDRQAGACTWRQAYAPVHPGDPEIGECWNWHNGYLKAIQDDPTVPDPTPASEVSDVVTSAGDAVSQVGQSLSRAFGGVSPWLLIGGGLLAMAALSGGSKS